MPAMSLPKSSSTDAGVCPATVVRVVAFPLPLSRVLGCDTSPRPSTFTGERVEDDEPRTYEYHDGFAAVAVSAGSANAPTETPSDRTVSALAWARRDLRFASDEVGFMTEGPSLH